MIRYVLVDAGHLTKCWQKPPRYQSQRRPMMRWKGSRQYIYRVVAHLVLGLVLDDSHQWACHHCDNPRCFNPEHLFIGTALTNNQDCIGKGRQGRRGQQKLTAGQQELIYRYHTTREFSMRELALFFGVTTSGAWAAYYRRERKYQT